VVDINECDDKLADGYSLLRENNHDGGNFLLVFQVIIILKSASTFKWSCGSAEPPSLVNIADVMEREYEFTMNYSSKSDL
jgi:hypothetical protein